MNNYLSHANILRSEPYRNLILGKNESALAKQLFYFMLRLRICEERLAAEYHPADEMKCPVHFCIGQEAIPAALSACLRSDDYLFSHHRSHGYYLAKGAPINKLFAELYGKVGGANGGIAGSQDISYPSLNFFSGAILAGATSIAMGAALAMKLKKLSSVAVAGFGESATDEGQFWETLNYAALVKLPVIFVCENNRYSVFSPQNKRSAQDNLSERAAAFGVRSTAIFGNDVMESYRILSKEIVLARAGNGPAFIEAYTYRWSGHYGPASDDLVGYRLDGELEHWIKNCPISILREVLLAENMLTSEQEMEWVREINHEIDHCFQYAKESPFPRNADWNDINYQNKSPLADKFLASFVNEKFDATQDHIQPKGY